METKYIVKVNGSAVSQPLTKILAEEEIKHLHPNQQKLAELVPVTDTGKEMLFG